MKTKYFVVHVYNTYKVNQLCHGQAGATGLATLTVSVHNSQVVVKQSEPSEQEQQVNIL